MKIRSYSILLLFLLGILGVMSFGCDSGSSSYAGGDSNVALRIYMLSGQDGTLTPTAQPNEYTLTFNSASPITFWYTDRPEREDGQEDVAMFVQNSWNGVYGGIAPNAIVQFYIPGDGAIEGIFVMLEFPEYDADTSTLTFQATLLNSTLTGDQGGALFFDKPVMTIINNAPDQTEATSFAQYADNAALQPADTAGQYTLIMDNVDPEVFWMENAPGRYSDVETVASFITNWTHRFGDIPPNASIVGNLSTGGRVLYLITLSNAQYDESANRATYTATLLGDIGEDFEIKDMNSAVLYIDAGAGNIPSRPFPSKVHGIAYSPVPAKFSQAPPQNTQFFDSDLVNNNFTAIWGSDGSCGRNDLQVMHDAGINLIRLYDYNYARGADREGTYGKGHINLLNKAQSLGIQVVIPVSNWNFSNNQYAWENIDTTVINIIESLKVNGEIHPAVHSFSVGNELDLDKEGLDYTVLIPRAIEVVKKINALAPDHYMTIPVSTWKQMDFFGWFQNGDGATISAIPSNIYNNRFYNSVQTFKRESGLTDLLALYDNDPRFDGIPLVITELGTSVLVVGSEAQMISDVINQAKTAENYLDTNADTRFKGYFIFQWQNANWKGGPGLSESSFGVHNYDGVLCTSVTGPHKGNQPQASTVYDVDRLVQKTSDQYPDGLLNELAKIFN